jgi:hypothetical protein
MGKEIGLRCNVANDPLEVTMHAIRNARPARAHYPFRLRDPVCGFWVRARFIARLQDIPDCCAAWEIVAPPLAAKPR